MPDVAVEAVKYVLGDRQLQCAFPVRGVCSHVLTSHTSYSNPHENNIRDGVQIRLSGCICS